MQDMDRTEKTLEVESGATGITVEAAGGDFGHQSAKFALGPRDNSQQRIEILSKVVPTETGLPTNNTDLAQRKLLESLDVTIKSKALTTAERAGGQLDPKAQGRFLVGNICNSERFRHRAKTASPEQKKSVNVVLYATGLTGLAVLAVRNLKARQDLLHIKVLTASLPVAQCDEANRAEVAARLTGTHYVTFNPGVGEVAPGRTITIKIDRVKVLPEGLGAALSQIYGIEEAPKNPGEGGESGLPQLTLTKRRDDLNAKGKEKTYLIYDIGGLTTDVDWLRGIRPVTENCEGLAFGVMDYLGEVVAEANAHYDEDTFLRSPAHLVEHLAKWNGTDEVFVKLRGEPKPIKQFLDRHFGALADLVATDIKKRWTAEIEAVFVVGGGACSVRPYLEKLLGPKYPAVIVAKDAQFQNALGNLMFAIQQAAKG